MSRIQWDGPKYLAALQKARDAGVNAYGLVVQQKTQQALNKGGGAPLSPAYRPSRPGAAPHLFIGALRRSITLQRSTGGRGEAFVGTNLRYAKGLEFGITIRAKTTKYLPIPLNPAARRIMVALGGRSLRNAPDLHPLTLKDGRVFLVRFRGKGQPPQFLFRLKESIRISPRPFLRPSLRAAKAAGQRAFNRALDATVRREFIAMGGTVA